MRSSQPRPLRCLHLHYENTFIAGRAWPRQLWLILFSLDVADTMWIENAAWAVFGALFGTSAVFEPIT